MDSKQATSEADTARERLRYILVSIHIDWTKASNRKTKIFSYKTFRCKNT